MRYLSLKFVCLSILFAGSAFGAEPLPDIVLILADDLGWKDLHCQGNPILRTPHLDGLANEGMRFTSAYAASPVCSPTRAALMTGLAPARLGITQHGDDGPSFWPENRKVQPPRSDNELSHQTTTIAEHLRELGYRTGFFGKWHLGEDPAFWPEHHGFDVNVGGCGFGGPPTYFDPYRIPSIPPRKDGEYLTDRLADEAINFLNQESKSPKFVCLWTYNPHYPFEAPEELVNHYRGKKGPGLVNEIYGGQIEATDRAIGRVLAAIDALESANDTLVIFTSDNGGWSGATDNLPLREGKGYLYEGGLRVPLIIRWPGRVAAASQCDTPVVSMDITATILDAVRANDQPAVESSLDGESLLPIFEGKEISRDAIFFHYPHFAFHKSNQPGSVVRSGKYKLIRRYDSDGGSDELYDLESDPTESMNVIEVQKNVAVKLRAKLNAWLTETNAALPIPVQ